MKIEDIKARHAQYTGDRNNQLFIDRQELLRVVSKQKSELGLARAFHKVAVQQRDEAFAEIQHLREKNRELNRRAQAAASQARKEYADEIWKHDKHRAPEARCSEMLGVDWEGKSWHQITEETRLALKTVLEENAAVRGSGAMLCLRDGYFAVQLIEVDPNGVTGFRGRAVRVAPGSSFICRETGIEPLEES